MAQIACLRPDGRQRARRYSEEGAILWPEEFAVMSVASSSSALLLRSHRTAGDGGDTERNFPSHGWEIGDDKEKVQKNHASIPFRMKMQTFCFE